MVPCKGILEKKQIALIVLYNAVGKLSLIQLQLGFVIY